MPSVILKKSDKLHALRGMLEAKYKTRWDRLMSRRAELAQQVYDETRGPVGYALQATAGKDWNLWLRVNSNVYLPDMPYPYCIVDTGKKRTVYRIPEIDHFGSGNPDYNDRLRRLGPQISLKRSVVFPSDGSEPTVYVKNASGDLRKKAGALKRDIMRFNRESRDFYRQAYNVLMELRSTRKVDAAFPELWKYLPDGMRERVKQAAVVITQDQIDAVRKQLP